MLEDRLLVATPQPPNNDHSDSPRLVIRSGQIRREELQSMLFLQKYTFLFPPPPPLPPMREMAIDVEHYKCPLIAFFNDQLMYFQVRPLSRTGGPGLSSCPFLPCTLASCVLREIGHESTRVHAHQRHVEPDPWCAGPLTGHVLGYPDCCRLDPSSQDQVGTLAARCAGKTGDAIHQRGRGKVGSSQ